MYSYRPTLHDSFAFICVVSVLSYSLLVQLYNTTRTERKVNGKTQPCKSLHFQVARLFIASHISRLFSRHRAATSPRRSVHSTRDRARCFRSHVRCRRRPGDALSRPPTSPPSPRHARRTNKARRTTARRTTPLTNTRRRHGRTGGAASALDSIESGRPHRGGAACVVHHHTGPSLYPCMHPPPPHRRTSL